MSASWWVVLLLTTVGVQYFGTAGAYLFAGRPGMALAFLGYVIANAGLAWDALSRP